MSDSRFDRLANARRVVDEANNQLQLEVNEARLEGLTWKQIGEALGISKQAASQRFNRPQVGNRQALQTLERELYLIAEEFFAALTHQDYARARSLMTYTASRAYPQRKLTKKWQTIVGACGAYVELTRHRFELTGTSLGLVYRLRHEHGEPVGQLTFNNRHQITEWVIYRNDTATRPE